MLLRHRRLTFLLAAVPFAAAAFAAACSSDNNSSPGPGTSPDDSGTSPVDGGNANTGDGGGGGSGGDADSGPPPTCIGNPLTAVDGGVDGGVILDAGGSLNAIATGPFLDGPRWIDDGTGAIVYSEVNAQAVVRNAPDGGSRTTLHETGAGNLPIGNAVAGGFLFTAVSTATAGGGSILRMQLDGGDPRTLDAGPANSPNGIVGSSKPFVYFTDPAFQSPALGVVTGVYRLGIDGAGLVAVQQFDGGANPGARADGIALSADGTTLYVGFFDEKRIMRYAVDAAGVASNPEMINFTPADGPTGIAVDVGGNLWIAESDAVDTNLRGRVEVVEASTGNRWGQIQFSDSRPTGVAFGGADGKTVYITTERNAALGTLYVYPSRCAGVR